MSYIHWESRRILTTPPKSSLKTVDQPDGGPGTAAGTDTTAGPAGAAKPRRRARGGRHRDGGRDDGERQSASRRHLLARSRMRMTR